MIETLTSEFGENITEVLNAAMAAIEAANATIGVRSTKISETTELAGQTLDIINFIEVNASGGLHNTEYTYALLGYASMLVVEAQATALEVQSNALGESVSTLVGSVSSLESEKTSLDSQVSSLESRVSTLESDIANAKSDLTTNMAEGAVTSIIISAVAVFLMKN